MNCTGNSEFRIQNSALLVRALRKYGADLFHVFPYVALRRRIPQQVGRMIRGNQHRVAVGELAAADAGDRRVGLEQALRGELAERDDDARLDEVDLAEE